MKKPYSLDYSIERDTDRVAAIIEILDQLEHDPPPNDLEQMASYILYGKDENGQNAPQRGETTDNDKRYNSFRKAEDKNVSLDAMIEDNLTDAITPVSHPKAYKKVKPSIAKPKYNKKTGEMIDPGDSDIPGMTELWERIAHLEHIAAVNDGKVAPDESTQIFDDDYRYYQFKHMLIDVRRHQYYLRDAYKPTLFFPGVDRPKAQFVDWTCDSFYWITEEEWRQKVADSLRLVSHDINDYETREENGKKMVKWVVRQHTFDWENPKHVRALIHCYNDLYEQLREKLDTYGRTLIFDFERYIEMAELSPVRQYVLNARLQKIQYPEILAGLQEKFGLKYNDGHVSSMITREIPEKIATTAKKHRLLIETPPEKCKKCFTCGRALPRDPLFFGRNSSRKDGFSSNCKECEKKKRIEKGGQSTHDRRNKEAKMYAVQAGETRN